MRFSFFPSLYKPPLFQEEPSAGSESKPPTWDSGQGYRIPRGEVIGEFGAVVE